MPLLFTIIRFELRPLITGLVPTPVLMLMPGGRRGGSWRMHFSRFAGDIPANPVFLAVAHALWRRSCIDLIHRSL